ncbi:MAG: amino acid permease [Heliobacteriaceae bacterium]|jgi:APA family basic amino acid/polyamine antiporter|nr:amino acid permease [Heliobacteriaceae bacterium]
MAKLYHRPTLTKNFLKQITKVKNPDAMLEEAKLEGLEKTLGVWDLIILGVGAIIGSGIFAVVGIAAAGGAESTGAGPALMISMVVAAVACIFSALCYSEFASMIPVAGGAYTYTFATLGEFAAWMVGWILMLEYAIGYIAVACAWSNYVVNFLKGFEAYLPAWLANPPVYLVNDFKSASGILTDSGIDPGSVIPTVLGVPVCVNIPAILIILAITMILIKGTKNSAKMATVMVIIKLAVIALFITAGAFYVQPENWVPFAPNGMRGIFMGAFIIFFAYIGFDALATTAEECKNPQKDLPVGIIGSLAVTTVVYVLVALVLTGVQPTSGVSVPAEFLKAPMAFIMNAVGMNWAAGLISVGSIAGLTSVLLVLQMAAARILYAMSRDNFISNKFQKLHPKFHTPHILTWTVAFVAIVGILTLDINVAAELCNFGTFTSFIVVCVAVLILRKTDPKRPRPFKVPFSPLFPALGIVCCGGLMIYSMQFLTTSSLLFPIWLGLGALIYFHYGYKKNRKYDNKVHAEKVEHKKQLKKTGSKK